MSKLNVVMLLSVAGGLAACSSQGFANDGKGDPTEGKSATAVELNAGTTLNTRISEYLEIDQLNASPAPEDANLVVGADPDGSLSRQFPGAGTFIDWNELGVAARKANHLLLDANDQRGRDPTSFPRSNECVGASQVLSKMDLTYISAANNSQYAYFGVQRSNNNGDAGYYWVFTKKTPHMTAGQAPCQADEKRLVYDFSAGDVLLAGHFKPSSAPLLRVFKAKTGRDAVGAVSAVDFTDSSLWQEDAGSLAAVAVNTTPTAPGNFGSAGVGGMKGQNLDIEIFAEAAVNLSLFMNGASSCGATYYGSVITRSSGAGGTSPDLKDLAGPALFNFGSTKATATLTGSCGGGLSYNATAIGPDGNPLQNPQCSWLFSNNQTSSSCSGTLEVGAGAYTGQVTVTDSSSSCADTQSTASATVHAPLSVKIQTVAAPQACSSMTSDAVQYKAVASGGAGGHSYTWSAPSGCAAGETCTIDPADGAFCVDTSFTATVTDSVCGTATSEPATYKKVTSVTATVAP